MALNPKGMETLRLMLRVIAGRIQTIDQIPEDQKFLFKQDPQNLVEVAISYVATKIAER